MSPKAKLLPIGEVKRRLLEDWALTVKARDGFKCLLCGSTELVTAHHWYVTKQRGRAASLCYNNGASLCFTCHIREVHDNPGYGIISRIYEAVVRNSPDFDEVELMRLININLTIKYMRTLYEQRFTDSAPISIWYTDPPEFHFVRGRISVKIPPDTRRHYVILAGKRVRLEYSETGLAPITATVIKVTEAGNDDRLTLEPTEELKQWILDNVE